MTRTVWFVSALPPSVAGEPPTLKYARLAACDPTDTQANTCVAPGTYQLNNWPGPNTWPAMVTIDVPAGHDPAALGPYTKLVEVRM